MAIGIFAGPNADTTANALAVMAEGAAQELSYEANWVGVKQLVANGLGPRAFPVGTQIADEWKQTDASEPLTAIWDVVHHSNEGMELNWHYANPEIMPFDAPEAIYYAPAGGLAAGQYYITISINYSTGWIAGHHINFTLTSAMAEGDQLYIDMGGAAAQNPTAGRTWNVYAKGSTTSKQSGTTSDSDSGTEVGATHSSSTVLPNGQINGIQRTVFGYNRWSQSAVRQYLNATGAAGAWWTAQNPWDRPPAQAATVRGWLGGCSEDFANSISVSEVLTGLNTPDAGAESKTMETTYDKVYLPSLTNLYTTPQIAGEGNEWDYYKELAEEAGITGTFHQGETYPILIKYLLNSQTTPAIALDRSLYRSGTANLWGIVLTGMVGTPYSNGLSRCCPACKIAKN